MRRRERNTTPQIAAGVGAGAISALTLVLVLSGWDPHHPFERNAPEVDRALADLDAGKIDSAEEALEKYLGTGVCGDGGIGLPDSVREKPNGSFDLGLILFYVAEKFGRPFGEEEVDAGGPGEADQSAQRSMEVDCALIVVKAIAADVKTPIELRARAYYLAGNLEFLRRHYEEAVKMYEEALRLIPGVAEDAGGDEVGRNAAHNRAIALRRIQDKDAGQDGGDGDDASSGQDAAADGGPQSTDGGNGDKGADAGKDGGGEDAGNNADKGDAGKDGGPQNNDRDAGDDNQDASAPEPQPSPQQPPAKPDQREDDRILDRLEESPTYQQEEAKRRAHVRRGRAMEDK